MKKKPVVRALRKKAQNKSKLKETKELRLRLGNMIADVILIFYVRAVVAARYRKLDIFNALRLGPEEYRRWTVGARVR